MILVIDNYDSFVHNLARHMELAGWSCQIVRNDALIVEQIERQKPAAIVLSPGPGTPKAAGICVPLIQRLGPKIPILGVCLGHQCIGEAYGAKVARAQKPVHGRASVIHHGGGALFNGLNGPFMGGRYHSLVVEPGTHSPLIVTARTAEGEVMAISHKNLPVHGVQFHPESVLTEHGMTIIKNFTALALDWNSRSRMAA